MIKTFILQICLGVGCVGNAPDGFKGYHFIPEDFGYEQKVKHTYENSIRANDSCHSRNDSSRQETLSELQSREYVGFRHEQGADTD